VLAHIAASYVFGVVELVRLLYSMRGMPGFGWGYLQEPQRLWDLLAPVTIFASFFFAVQFYLDGIMRAWELVLFWLAYLAPLGGFYYLFRAKPLKQGFSLAPATHGTST
jgi:hypothetical protein